MPRVPVYDAPRVMPSVSNAGTFVAPSGPTAGAIASEQIQQQARSLGEVGNALGRIALDAQEQANQVRVSAAMNDAVGARTRLTYDPAEGYVHLRGDAALKRPEGKPLDDEYAEKLKARLSEIEGTLGNDAQRRAFGFQSAQLFEQFRGGVQQHVGREFGDYAVSVQHGTVRTAQQQMALAWGDVEVVGQSVGAIKAATYEEGRLRGWSPQQTSAATIDALSRGHAAVLAGAVDGGSLDYAREYLLRFGAEMTPDARLAAKHTLDLGDFETRTQNKADELWGQHGGDLAAALAATRKTLQGKEEDAVVQRLKSLDAERVTLRERGQRDAADQAWRVFADTGSVGRVPPSVLAAMDGKDLEALRRTARADAEARANRTEVKTDPEIYYALSIAAAGDPNFKSEDLRHYFDKLSPTDRKHFIDLQSKFDRPEKAAEVVSTTEQKSAMVKALGLVGTDAGVFHQVADRALFNAQQAKGSPLNQDERQKVLDRLAVQGKVPARWVGTDTTRLFKAIADGLDSKFDPEFTNGDKRAAAAALQRRGVTHPTAQQIDALIRARYQIAR